MSKKHSPKPEVSRRKFLQSSSAAVLGTVVGSKLAFGDEKNKIVKAAIYPGIGVARIGNSQEKDGYYIGPEVTTPPLTFKNGIRDKKGALKRQAARFRMYGLNAAGKGVR